MGKTIAKELFDIAEAQGGSTAGYPPTIAGAVDALTDALAGSDVDSGRTIAEAVAVMGEYIGGGGGSIGAPCLINASQNGELVGIRGVSLFLGNDEVFYIDSAGTEILQTAGGLSARFTPAFTYETFDESKLKAELLDSEQQKIGDFTDYEIIWFIESFSGLKVNVPNIVGEDMPTLMFTYNA